MKVTLLNTPTLSFVDTGVGMCWGKGGYGADTPKGRERIDRVCNKFRHSSMLRFADYIFEVELSTSALLEWTRHQTGVDYAVESTRYCISNIAKSDSSIPVEYSNNQKVNDLMDSHIQDIITLILEDKPSNDDVKLLLPQGYIYKMQVKFNAQSLQHFIKLRSDKPAHFHIRKLAVALYSAIPPEHKYLFVDSLYKEPEVTQC